ncbi:baseplate multidomain protein megatron [Chelativorans alearense]|uniref:baseplate multidomain protein megatron n=1 Tax=Chelativorans alearense TaxID=2681495 RepID=UPI0013D3E6FC|nr:glycoside hydrolase TIM-barrel-like domain-containing protein [Chelativorans alearense]
MASLLLGVAGKAIGAALFPGSFGLFGATISGAAIGGAIGSAAGYFIDQTLFAQNVRAEQKGARLNTATITSSAEGTAITRLQGRRRLGGQIIWATRFEEEISKETQTSGGKGGGKVSVTTTTYLYYANLAVGLCEGKVSRIGRIWADGKEVDQTEITVRKYLGDEEQMPDSLIEAKEGAGNAPAYRGLAYVVFERLPLNEYGRRIPQITVEVFRSVGDLEPLVKGVCLIPGATEFGYEPEAVVREVGEGDTESENRHALTGPSDWHDSLDTLEALAPACQAVLFVVAWFGNDLRCAACEIKPKVESADRVTLKGSEPFDWEVAGLTRAEVDVMSQVDGAPAFGGTPNDASVIAAIKDLKDRGFAVIFYPFVMMDIEQGNTLPDPYSNNAGTVGQPAYPWRGRITCSPAPGFTGTPDKTASAGGQVDDFFNGTWGYRNFVLHYAQLCAGAGGVDGFVVGSEMVGLTTVRDTASTYPFVAHLQALAGDVRAIVGGATKIGYAADWSEYHSHRPADGSGDVFFHLDPLWADPEIDFIGIDNYLPIADWRDGTEHADYDPDGPTTTYDQDYLRGNIEGGEYFDWYYASDADRDAQARTAITDGAYGEPWAFRQKDMKSWWSGAHHNRPDGVRDPAATAFVPEGKPIWFTELGCPAVDKGANQPNVFADPKSSESAVPYFSSGVRDDAIQRAFLEAVITYWEDLSNNPSSGVYAGRMIETNRLFLWSWDARPAPSFPQDGRTWGDADNWELGHWLSGRLGAAPARETVIDIFERAGFSDYDVRPIGSVVDAVAAEQVMSPRALIEALASVHALQAVESGDVIRVESRLGLPTRATLALDDIVRPEEGEELTRTRMQETDLPAEVSLTYSEPVSDDQPGAVRAIRQTTTSRRTAPLQAPVTMPASKAQGAVERILRDQWWGRETIDCGLPPSMKALEPGDMIRFAADGETYRIAELTDAEYRRMRAGRSESDMFAPGSGPKRERGTSPNLATGAAAYAFIDGPLLNDDDSPWGAYVAARARPWRGGVAFYRSPEETGFTLDTLVSEPAGMGRLAFDFYAGPVSRWDNGNELWVDIAGRQLASADALSVFAGSNALAVENADGEWEIVQFADAELMQPGRYRLTRLLRGQKGSEHAMRAPVAAGARVVVLDTALRQTGLTRDDKDTVLNWRIGPANRDVADNTYKAQSLAIAARAARPLSPVHVRGAIEAATGDAELTWVRRTRIGGDSWAQVEVPLGEETEAYEVDVLNGAEDVVRTIAVAAPAATYAQADQTADGIAPPFDVIVYQLSESFGRGIGERITVYG